MFKYLQLVLVCVFLVFPGVVGAAADDYSSSDGDECRMAYIQSWLHKEGKLSGVSSPACLKSYRKKKYMSCTTIQDINTSAYSVYSSDSSDDDTSVGSAKSNDSKKIWHPRSRRASDGDPALVDWFVGYARVSVAEQSFKTFFPCLVN